MSPGLESRGAEAFLPCSLVGLVGVVTPETSKKKKPGTFAISKMIGKKIAPSHSHSFRKR